VSRCDDPLWHVARVLYEGDTRVPLWWVVKWGHGDITAAILAAWNASNDTLAMLSVALKATGCDHRGFDCIHGKRLCCVSCYRYGQHSHCSSCNAVLRREVTNEELASLVPRLLGIGAGSSSAF